MTATRDDMIAELQRANATLQGRLDAALTQRISEHTERSAHQAATIDVLKAMSASPGDPQPVFDLICRQARALLNVIAVTLFEFDGTLVHLRTIDGGDVMFDTAAGATYLSGWPRVPDRGSPTCRAIMDCTVVHIRDLDAEPGISQAVRDLGNKTQVSIPMMRDGRAIGAITTASMQVDGVSDTQIELLKTFAEQAAIAITSAETYRALQVRTADLQESLEQQTATAEVLQVINASPGDLAPVFDAMLEKAMRLCQAAFGNLAIYDGVNFRPVAHQGVPAEIAQEVTLIVPEPGSVLDRVAKGDRMVQIPDIVDTDGYRDGLPSRVRLADRFGARTALWVALRKDDAVLGVFVIFRREVRAFSDKQIALLENFAAQAVIAMESARLLNELHARTDELAQRQAELRVTFENMGDGVAMFDETQHLVAWNRKFQDILDVPDDIIARRQTFTEYVQYLAERGEYGPDADPEDQIRRLTERTGEYRAYERVRPDGRVIEIRHNPVPGGGFVLIYADITERKRNEAEIAAARDAAEAAARTIEAGFRELKAAQANLIQAEKMASLGQLTAGIAHEIKNPLNFVNNFAELSVDLLGELKDAVAPARVTLTPDQREDVDDVVATLTSNLKKITEHGKRADGIVKAMLEHSRGASGERRTVDINALADEALNLAYHGARAQDQSFNITLERDFSADIAPIDVNPQDMTRVLLNLFSNGFYAANKRARNDSSLDFKPTLKLSTRDVGDTVEIRVRDNGTGIPADIADKLFQPFFTTKPTGEGTGLGLSITYDIVTKAHGGTIAADSEVDEFTEFVVTLPRMFAREGAVP